MTHFYGYLPDPRDERDFLYRNLRPTHAQFPAVVDLRKLTSPVRDQGDLGSCTGFAIASGMKEFLFNLHGVKNYKMSPRWLYYQERKIEGTIREDAGAYPRDGFKVLRKLGCALESECVYDIDMFARKPSAHATEHALRFKIKDYHRIDDLYEAKTCLVNGSGFMLGFKVYESFEDIGRDGMMPMPRSGEQVLGGHAVFVAGYKNNRFIIKNSWGEGWGDRGYFYMPFDYVCPDFVSDMWVAE